MSTPIHEHNPVRGLGRKLHKALLDNYAYANFLDGCGWTWGGCFTLAKAIKIWLGEEDPKIEMMHLVENNPTRRPYQHAIIKVGRWYIDGDGITTKRTMLNRWDKRNLRTGEIANPTIEPSGDENFEYSHFQQDDGGGQRRMYSAENITAIIRYLEERFDKIELLNLLLN